MWTILPHEGREEIVLESGFRRSWAKKFEADGRGLLWRIPDTPPVAGPDGMHSSGTRPCDLVGVLAGGGGGVGTGNAAWRGAACAFECKLQKGGAAFSVDHHFKGRLHQLRELSRFADMGGYAVVVVGWIPTGKSRTITFEVPVDELSALDRMRLDGEEWERWKM